MRFSRFFLALDVNKNWSCTPLGKNTNFQNRFHIKEHRKQWGNSQTAYRFDYLIARKLRLKSLVTSQLKIRSVEGCPFFCRVNECVCCRCGVGRRRRRRRLRGSRCRAAAAAWGRRRRRRRAARASAAPPTPGPPDGIRKVGATRAATVSKHSAPSAESTSKSEPRTNFLWLGTPLPERLSP